jgi:hypothetical protein
MPIDLFEEDPRDPMSILVNINTFSSVARAEHIKTVDVLIRRKRTPSLYAAQKRPVKTLRCWAGCQVVTAGTYKLG